MKFFRSVIVCLCFKFILYLINYLLIYNQANGLQTIVTTLIDLFINSGTLTLEKTSPLKPMDFIYEVLVPEVALRLIRDDYNNNITNHNEYNS